MLIEIVNIINICILFFFIVLSFGYIVLLFASLKSIYRDYEIIRIGNLAGLTNSNSMPPVTIIISAFNEESRILDAIYSILRNDYRNKHIIVVNDGSTDQTLNKLIETFNLIEFATVSPDIIKADKKAKKYYASSFDFDIIVIDKENSGKSDSLNLALNLCRTPYFITTDADTILAPDAITNIMFYALSRKDMVAVGGGVYVLNGCEYKDGVITKENMSYQPLVALQTCEYLRSFLFSRAGWNAFGGAMSMSGALTLLDYQAVIDVGGFDRDNLAQDFEIITHLHAYKRLKKEPYTVAYTASSIAFTLVPDTLKKYWRQRYFWQMDSLRSLFRYQNMLFNPRYGISGLFTYPFYLFGDTLGAMVEFTAYLMIFVSWFAGVLDARWAILFFIICWGFVTCLTMATALISFLTYNKYGKLLNLLWILCIVLLESFGFRQYYVACRVYATFSYFMKSLTSRKEEVKKEDGHP